MSTTEPTEQHNETKPEHEAATPTQELASKLESFRKEAAGHLKEAGRLLSQHKQASTVAAVCIVFIALAVFAATANFEKSQEAQALPLKSEQMQNVGSAISAKADACTAAVEAGIVAQSLTPDALKAVPAAADAPTTFSLIEGTEVAALSGDEAAALSEALSQLSSNGYTVGCMLVNLSTGKGLAYNLDSAYTAPARSRAPTPLTCASIWAMATFPTPPPPKRQVRAFPLP